MSMEDILSDTKPEPVATTDPVVAAPEPTPAPVAAVTDSAPAAEPIAAEPIDETTGMTPKEKAFYTKSKDETRKRQELEREFAVLKAQVEQAERAKQSVTTQPEPPKEFWEDPEGVLKAHQEQIKQQVEESRRLSTNTRLDVSEMMVKREHPDYPEKLAIFKQIADQNPHVVQQMLSAENPAEFVYNLAKNQQELKQAGDLPTLRAQIEKETRLKLEAEFKAKEEAKAAELANIPQSLTGVRSTGVNKPVWSGPPSMDDILH